MWPSRNIDVSLDGFPNIISFKKGERGTRESMRYLPCYQSSVVNREIAGICTSSPLAGGGPELRPGGNLAPRNTIRRILNFQNRARIGNNTERNKQASGPPARR